VALQAMPAMATAAADGGDGGAAAASGPVAGFKSQGPVRSALLPSVRGELYIFAACCCYALATVRLSMVAGRHDAVQLATAKTLVLAAASAAWLLLPALHASPLEGSSSSNSQDFTTTTSTSSSMIAVVRTEGQVEWQQQQQQGILSTGARGDYLQAPSVAAAGEDLSGMPQPGSLTALLPPNSRNVYNAEQQGQVADTGGLAAAITAAAAAVQGPGDTPLGPAAVLGATLSGKIAAVEGEPVQQRTGAEELGWVGRLQSQLFNGVAAAAWELPAGLSSGTGLLVLLYSSWGCGALSAVLQTRGQAHVTAASAQVGGDV
jgi:drug/metabolite transporter (DMT)-like permease